MKSCPCTCSFPWLLTLSNLDLPHGGLIRWTRFVGASGGGIQLNVDGMTAVNDAGGVGNVPLAYNPTTNAVQVGTTYNVLSDPTNARVRVNAGGTLLEISGADGNLRVYCGAIAMTLSASGQLNEGWLLAKGVSGDDRSDFITLDESAAAAVGSKWRIQTVTAAAYLAGRGGIRRYSTATVTPCVLDGWQNSYSAQDAYRIYSRFAMQQIVNCRFAVGVTDAPAAVAANSLPYVNEGILCVQDDAVGPNYLLRQVTGGAVVDDDSTIAVVAGEYHILEVLVATTRIPTLFIDGTLRATGAVGDSPAAATLLRKVIYADNIGAAVSAQFDIDIYDIVESRNMAVTA